uniref:Uncharacterized protein n=1 Tax=Athene cunicularia TaxID=194338 RepID=A0A663N3B5_ATHCN
MGSSGSAELLLWSSQTVKQIMEEAVTRKFVHEDSSHIISFCGESPAYSFCLSAGAGWRLLKNCKWSLWKICPDVCWFQACFLAVVLFT